MAKDKLGVLYLDGRGVNQHHRKAFELFKQSADEQNADGMTNLEYCYFYGFGIKADKQKAFELRWLQN